MSIHILNVTSIMGETEPNSEIFTLEFFLQPSLEAKPLILILPGGGYQHWAIEKEGRAVAEWLYELGFHAAVLTYPIQKINPEYMRDHFEQIVQKVNDFIWKEQCSYTYLGIMGFSAGGHLAALAANTYPEHFDFSLLCYPVITMTEAFGHAGSIQNFLGDSPSLYMKKRFSNELLVTKETGPTFIWHTANDQSVPVENTIRYVEALTQHNIPFESHIFPDGPHGLGLALDQPIGQSWTTLAENWLNQWK